MKFKSISRCLLCTIGLFYTISNYSQNLLDTSSWSVGSGGVSGFGLNGSAIENSRELGMNHIGEEVVLWRASPAESSSDPSPNPDGGWNTSFFNIDNTKTYRFSVWLKKTNSQDGNTYFGAQRWRPDTNIYPETILNLNNTVNRNPYFRVGDLPELDKWYLLVGFIHHKDYSESINIGAIYDGVTGEFIQNITDFKFTSTTSQIRHRAYLFYDDNHNDEQFFWEPRIDVVNGTEPTINELLHINVSSKLIFAYDNAGNQKQRFYCSEPGCVVPNAPAGKIPENIEVTDVNNLDTEIDQNYSNDDFSIYPNPTKGLVTLKLNSGFDKKIAHDINIYNSNGVLINIIHNDKIKNQLEIDMTLFPSGVYFVHFHLNNGKSITKQIIKN